ncbi:hypothetical protein [Streptomyces sp. NPDC047981]|uniref:hypothetical protein n=1 Tax=Streptomyces sp. NPDC047981 TaxID=3154610 RepID=UPI003414DBD6
MASIDRAVRDRKAFEERLKTAAEAGRKNARRYANDWWGRLRAEELTAENVRMDGFFEAITGYQFQIELWANLIEALEVSGDVVATWHEKIAEAERNSEQTGGSIGNPVADARQYLWRDANEKFARYAADYFRRVG